MMKTVTTNKMLTPEPVASSDGMLMMRLLKRVVRSNRKDQRFATLVELVAEAGRASVVQEIDGCRNLIVPAINREAVMVLTSHYDVHGESWGWNDNGSGLAVLLSLLDDVPPHVEFVFTDNEEIGYRGAHAYLAERGHQVAANINVDVVAIPGRLYVERLGWTSEVPNATEIFNVPFNDSWAFREAGIPSLLVCSAGEGHTDTFSVCADIWNYQHGGRMDRPDGWRYLCGTSMVNARNLVRQSIQTHGAKPFAVTTGTNDP